jgi:fucose permease
MSGGLVGLVILDRLLAHVEARRLLAAASATGTLLYLLWLQVDDLVLSAGLLFATGMVCSSFYPLAKAQAYRSLPGQSGTVNAVSSLFSPVTYALPLLLGLVADRWGLGVTLLLLVGEPAGMLLLALAAPGQPSTDT